MHIGYNNTRQFDSAAVFFALSLAQSSLSLVLWLVHDYRLVVVTLVSSAAVDVSMVVWNLFVRRHTHMPGGLVNETPRRRQGRHEAFVAAQDSPVPHNTHSRSKTDARARPTSARRITGARTIDTFRDERERERQQAASHAASQPIHTETSNPRQGISIIDVCVLCDVCPVGRAAFQAANLLPDRLDPQERARAVPGALRPHHRAALLQLRQAGTYHTSSSNNDNASVYIPLCHIHLRLYPWLTNPRAFTCLASRRSLGKTCADSFTCSTRGSRRVCLRPTRSRRCARPRTRRRRSPSRRSWRSPRASPRSRRRHQQHHVEAASRPWDQLVRLSLG